MIDGLVRSTKTPFSVIPAKAGIQEKRTVLDPGFRRGDGFDDLLRSHQDWQTEKERSVKVYNCGKIYCKWL
jgi:hypothetical protein